MLIRFFRGIWRGLDTFRRLIHLVLMLAIFAGLVAVFSRQAPRLPGAAALVVAPTGRLVEQAYGDPLEQALEEFTSQRRAETAVRDVIDALRAARDDERIRAVFLSLDDLVGADLAKLQQVGAEIDAFRATGRKVVAYGDYFSQAQYFLAAHADEVYLHPSGVVYLDGYGRYRTYYRSAIDKLRIDWHVFRVGEYKSFVEPYTRDDMSPQDRASSAEWLAKLWRQYQVGAERARGLEAGTIGRYATDFAANLARERGDLARLALAAGLVDELRTRDEVRARMIRLAGEDPRGHSFQQIDFETYVAATRTRKEAAGIVGVVVAAGEILDGEQPPGTIGGDTLARLLQQARHNNRVKAVVLRIDSPGGSKFASEIIDREVQLLRAAGKPVIASMSGVAASGGYYIAMNADEIWAAPSTITGSIGIGAYFPTFSRSLDALGINVDGVGTTPWSGQFRPDRELSDAATKVLQLSIEHGYREFVGSVADARGMTVDAVDAIAQGRVWVGETAVELGLIDKLGGLDDAIAAAAAQAGLGDTYGVRYIEKQLSFRESMMVNLATRARAWMPRERQRNGIDRFVTRIADEFERLGRLNDPQHLYYHCLCDIR